MKYLVPFDFTPIACNALSHALQLSEHNPGEIELLHIAASPGQKAEARKALEKIALSNTTEDQKVTERVVVGSIFSDIASEAERSKADLLVMGTHGEKGLQRIFGSHALKVITSSRIPFIVTQNRPPKPIKEILMPVDFSIEKIEVSHTAAHLAATFNAEVHLLHQPVNDTWLVQQLKNNIAMVQEKLRRKGLTHFVVQLGGDKSFGEEVMKYGNGRDCMYAIGHFTEGFFPQLERFSQNLLTNPEQAPVLIMNAAH